MATRVAVVVLNWNHLEETRACLRSVFAARGDQAVILVDNASDEDPAELVREFPRLRLARQSRNLGYAGGNNAGLRLAFEAGADYVLILNNDVVIEPDMIVELLDVAERYPRACFVTARVLQPDSDRAYWDGGIIDWARGDVWHTSEQLPRRDGIVESQWSNGCALLVRAVAAKQIGLMDDSLFLYYEDVDWSARATLAGWQHLVALKAVCTHGVSKSTGGMQAPASRFYFARNRFRVLRRYSPQYHLAVVAAARYALRLARDYYWLRRDPPARRALIDAARALLGNRWGPYQPREDRLGQAVDRAGALAAGVAASVYGVVRDVRGDREARALFLGKVAVGIGVVFIVGTLAYLVARLLRYGRI